jgi:hypothetical protein
MLLSLLAALLSAAASPSPAPPPASREAPVILFLVDNSASLPPIDPEEKRVQALEKIFSFLQGQRYRLVLFGGRGEVFVDDVARYRNDGQWTDFYFAFEKAREIVREYPEGTEFRAILMTDGIHDPAPRDWEGMGVPAGADLKAHALERTLALIREMKVPLYVILVGELPKEGIAPGDRELSPVVILDMVRAANGAAAGPTAQSLASFFADDGLLLKKFVYRVEPHQGLKKIEPIVRRIVAPARAGVEASFLSALVLPLTLFLFLLLGILVRSFPGRGDVEVLELARDQPLHVAVDRMRKVEGGWATTGLSLVADARDAAATFLYEAPHVELSGLGLDTDGLDELSRRLLPLGVDDLRRALQQCEEGTKEEKIYALNLDYVAKNFDAKEAERILATPVSERKGVSALDFLRAKAHLVSDEELRRKLTEPRVHIASAKRNPERRQLAAGERLQIGPYGFLVREVEKGGRKDVRVALVYERVPSLLGLKIWLPAAFQRVFRLRRTAQRIVA